MQYLNYEKLEVYRMAMGLVLMIEEVIMRQSLFGRSTASIQHISRAEYSRGGWRTCTGRETSFLSHGKAVGDRML